MHFPILLGTQQDIAIITGVAFVFARRFGDFNDQQPSADAVWMGMEAIEDDPVGAASSERVLDGAGEGRLERRLGWLSRLGRSLRGRSWLLGRLGRLGSQSLRRLGLGRLQGRLDGGFFGGFDGFLAGFG